MSHVASTSDELYWKLQMRTATATTYQDLYEYAVNHPELNLNFTYTVEGKAGSLLHALAEHDKYVPLLRKFFELEDSDAGRIKLDIDLCIAVEPFGMCTPLMSCACAGSCAIAETLLARSPELCLPACQTIAAAEGHEGMLSTLQRHCDAVCDEDHANTDIHAVPHDRKAALLLASNAGHAAIVSLLLKSGVDMCVYSRGFTCLMRAAVNGHADVISALVNAAGRHGPDFLSRVLEARVDAEESSGCTSLMLAARGGHLTCISILLQAGADVNAADGHGWTSLMHAAANGSVEIVTLLLEAGADHTRASNADVNAEEGQLDITGSTALAVAALRCSTTSGLVVWRAGQESTISQLTVSGSVACIHKLLMAGALVNTADKYGTTPLMKAASCGSGAAVSLLYEAGASINATQMDGRTALISAANRGHVDVVSQLMTLGADVEAADLRGNTALVRAALSGRPTVVEFLLQAGANIYGVDKVGRTLLMNAFLGRSDTVIAMVLQADTSGINDVDDTGQTCLMLAMGGSPSRRAVATSIIGLLRAGADVHAIDNDGGAALTRVLYSHQDTRIVTLLAAGALLTTQPLNRTRAAVDGAMVRAL